MDLKTVHNFVARGEVFRDNLSGPVTITGSYPIYAPDPRRVKKPHPEGFCLEKTRFGLE